jgi:hypothetical protein
LPKNELDKVIIWLTQYLSYDLCKVDLLSQYYGMV